MTDKTTKLLLALIALALFLNAASPLFNPRPVRAGDSLHCTGDMKASVWGASEPNIGGYKVDVTCE